MSITTSPNYLTEGKRLIFVKDNRANDEISLMTLPNSYQSISYLSLTEMIRDFDDYIPLPDAILINLDSLAFNRVRATVNALKKHDLLKDIPVIGLKRITGKRLKNELPFSINTKTSWQKKKLRRQRIPPLICLVANAFLILR